LSSLFWEPPLNLLLRGQIHSAKLPLGACDPFFVCVLLQVFVFVVFQEQAIRLEGRVRFLFAVQKAANNCSNLNDKFDVVVAIKLELTSKEPMFLLECGDLGKSSREEAKCALNEQHVVLALDRGVVLQDAPEHVLRHEQLFDLHHVHQDKDHLVAGIVKAFAPKQKLNHVFAIDLLVVLEEYMERDVGLDHILS